MNGRRIVLVLFAVVLALYAVVPALAQDETPTPLVAVLKLEPLGPQPVGTRPTVIATLVNLEGRVIPNKVLFLSIDGERVRQIRTDDLGIANIRISRDLPVGEYAVTVEFPGTEAYLPASASMTLVMRPMRLTVETVPPVPNVTFTLDGETFVSGPDGLAELDIDEPGTYELSVDGSELQIDPDTRAAFARWADSTFQPERDVEVSGDVRLQAGFNTSHPIGLTFSDLSGALVDTARVTSVTFKRSNGSYHTYENGEPQWLLATRVVRRAEGLEASPLLYSVESVMIDGTTAVNRYQQRFYVEHADTWDIQLLLYSARITATDAIFGFQIGSGVTLQYPDGREEHLEFGKDGDVIQASMARGLYYVQVTGVRGMAPLTPIALSKDQDVELKVLSAFDIGVGITSGLAIALALLLIWRPHLPGLVLGGLRRSSKRKQSGTLGPVEHEEALLNSVEHE